MLAGRPIRSLLYPAPKLCGGVRNTYILPTRGDIPPYVIECCFQAVRDEAIMLKNQ
jgi:hypothetical protein